MKILFILSACLLLIACDSNSKQVIDQCMRREIFAQCMKLLPKGPVTTRANDWDEVVHECDNAAYGQSARKALFVKPECRAK